MDPLSLTASIIAILQLTQSLTNYINSVRSASKEQKQIAIEASNLYCLLTTLKFRVEDANSNDPWFNQVKLLGLKGGLLQQLRELLEKLVEKIPKPAASSASSVSRVIDASRSKLTWQFAQKDVEKLLTQIERIKTLINLALVDDLTTLAQEIDVNVTSLVEQFEQIKIGVDVIRDSVNVDLQNKLLNWLGLPDPSLNYRAAVGKRQAHTGLWLTKSRSFQDWKSSKSSSLWLHGKAGCGKTILCSTALEDVQSDISNLPDACMSYFYFDFNDRDKQSSRIAVRSIVFQLCLQVPHCLQALERLYKSCQNGSQQPREEAISELFQDCLVSAGEKYILLDALDECADREPLLEFLERLIRQNQSRLHILMTSRFERDIQDYLEPIVTFKIDTQSSVVDGDIREYILDRLENDRQLKKWPPPVKDEIVQKLMTKANGMFRWAFCQLESLRGCIRLSSLRQALLALPKTLDETYERIIQQIEGSGELDCALWLIQWLCFSARPLRLSEMNEILAILPDSEMRFCPEECLPDPFDIVRICPSLITCVPINDDIDNEVDSEYSDEVDDENSDEVDDGSPGYEQTLCELPNLIQVQLAHYSVKEYFLSERSPFQSHFRADRSHEQIAEACLHYLLYMCQDIQPTTYTTKKYPLASYAFKKWALHAKELDGRLNESVMDTAARLFLDDELKSALARRPDPNSIFAEGGLFEGLEQEPMVMALTEFGVIQLMSCAIDRNFDIEESIEYGLTPLLIATGLGDRMMVELLVDSGANIETGYNFMSTPLILASSRGFREVVDLLIRRGADIEARDVFGGTALLHAIKSGSDKVVQLLLDRGADVEARDNDGMSALCHAAELGRDESVRVLLERGADVNAKGPKGRTPLNLALFRRKFTTAQVLRDHGAIDECDEDSGGHNATHDTGHGDVV